MTQKPAIWIEWKESDTDEKDIGKYDIVISLTDSIETVDITIFLEIVPVGYETTGPGGSCRRRLEKI